MKFSDRVAGVAIAVSVATLVSVLVEHHVQAEKLRLHQEAVDQQIRDADIRLLTEKRDRIVDDMHTLKMVEWQHTRIDGVEWQLMRTPDRNSWALPHVTVDRDEPGRIPPQDLPTRPKE